MCGLAAIFSSNSFKAHSLIDMINVISHRGPDDEGIFLVDETKEVRTYGGPSTPDNVYKSSLLFTPTKSFTHIKDTRFYIGLGHRRLAILDLSPGGHQPMSYKSRDTWIVYNGEIYNYIEIKKELINLGYAFYTESDTEVILAAFSEWGTSCMNKFVGMWSFIIYNIKTNEVFASRDRYGIKPLYYWVSPENQLHFASEIKQFTVLRNWIPKVNKRRAADYLTTSYTDHTTETMYQDVYQVPGGHFLNFNALESEYKSIVLEKWYNPELKPFSGDFKMACSEFNKLFKEAIDIHLRSDVPLGSALSGGLDSSAIVCEINSILKNNSSQHLQNTFSSCSEFEAFDERKWMDIVIQHTKINASFVYPKFERLFRLTNELIWIHDEPYQSQSVFLGYHVFEKAKNNNVKVLLNGQGADEYLGGYGQFSTVRLVGLLKKFKLLKLTNDISNANKEWGSNEKWQILKLIYNLQPSSLKEKITLNKRNKFNACINYNILNIKPQHPNTSIPLRLDSVKNITDYHLFYNPLNKYLKWEDRNSMANSIEARVPFLDHRLVEFCQGLNVEFLEKGGERKRILRQGLKGLLPEQIRLRKDKKGFITPEEKWVRNNPEVFRNKLYSSIEKSNGIINSNIVKHFDEIISGKRAFDYSYWRFILFSEWLEKFNLSI